MKWKDLPALVKEASKDWGEDKVPRLAAALSYYTLFSIAPLLIVVIAIAGAVFGKEAASGQIAAQMRGTIGPQAAEAIQGIVRNAHRPAASVIASILGIL